MPEIAHEETESTEENYTNDLTINEFELDKEWLKQASVFYQHSSALANSRYELDQCKASLDVVKAKVESCIRTNPDQFGLSKVTEGSIASAVTVHVDVMEAIEKLNKNKYSVNMLEASVEALQHKKRALESLVQLHAMGYFSEPRSTCDKTVEEAIKRKQFYDKQRKGH